MTNADIAVLMPAIRSAESTVQYRVPIEHIPDGAREGETLEMQILPDPKRREDLQREVRKMLKEFQSERPDLHGRLDETAITALMLSLLRSAGKETTRGLVISDVRKAAEKIGKAVYARLCS
jgi:hypothetical protein